MTEPNTVIWSGEHRAYWREKACGYTQDVTRAGIWPFAEAERMTRHCGPDKQIQLRLKHEVPEPRMQRLLTVWWWIRCRWTGHHHWHEGRCTVCGIGVYGQAKPATEPPTSP